MRVECAWIVRELNANQLHITCMFGVIRVVEYMRSSLENYNRFD